ncbi:MAG: hypothetical protein JXA94_04640 [Parachlamydiales bacterium]|nr:hypothetical protein [Parachlamydiales bacterium]
MKSFLNKFSFFLIALFLSSYIFADANNQITETITEVPTNQPYQNTNTIKNQKTIASPKTTTKTSSPILFQKAQPQAQITQNNQKKPGDEIETNTAPIAQEDQSNQKVPSLISTSSKSVMTIDIKNRTLDLFQAYNDFKKNVSASRIVFLLNNKQTISNIIDVTIAPNNTALFLKVSTIRGVKQITLFTEDISSISTQ